MIGDAVDILSRVKRLIPRRWFAWVAPYRDAVLGGLAASSSWCYGLIGYARAQSRISTAYGIWLDIIAYDYLGLFLTRNGAADDAFRTIIRATILQERVTRNGMVAAVTVISGAAPWVFEPWNTFDTGAYSGSRASGSPQYGSMGYGVGHGGYGNMNLPGQVFMNVIRGYPGGIPNVDGYANPVGGWGAGSIEYTGALGLTGITNDMIYRLISMTKPTGTTCWVSIGGPPRL